MQKLFNSIPAASIEDAVIDDIFSMIGDRPTMEAATKAAIPNLQEIEDRKAKIEEATKLIRAIELKKDRLIDQIVKNNISDDDVKERMSMYKSQIEKLQSEINLNKNICENLPSPESVSMKIKLMLRLKQDILRSYGHLSKMSFDQKENYYK